MRIIRDVFPAHLAVVPAGEIADVYDLKSSPATKGSHYVATTRVVVTDEAVIVAQDSPNGAQIIFQEKYEVFLKGDENRVVTKSGKMLAFSKDTNCGCGSRLRSWNPYRTLNSIKDNF